MNRPPRPPRASCWQARRAVHPPRPPMTMKALAHESAACLRAPRVREGPGAVLLGIAKPYKKDAIQRALIANLVS